jgi:hypothetical protein
MSQAGKPNTTIPTRRALLAGAPAVAMAALAVGTAVNGLAIAAGALPTQAGDDADLLALRDRFDPVYEEWKFCTVAAQADLDDFNALVDCETVGMEVDGPEYLKVREQLARKGRVGRRLDIGQCDRMNTQLYPFADEILSFRSVTLEGLRLQVRAYISSYSESWDPEECADDWSRNFVEVICAFTGVEFPPYGEAMAPHVRTVPSSPPEPDPIYAAIERHRRARSEANALVAAADVKSDHPHYATLQKPVDKAWRKEDALVWKLVEIKPTTAAGLTALIRYVVEMEEPRSQLWPEGWEREFRRACLRSTQTLVTT